MRNTGCVFKQHNYTLPYKNEVQYTASTWAEWTKSAGVVADSSGVEFTSNGTGLVYIEKNTSFKANTKYLTLYNVVSSNINGGIAIGSSSRAGAFSPAGKTVGNQKIVANTLASILSNSIIIYVDAASTAGTKIKIKDIRIVELVPGSQLESDANNLTANQLNAKYPYHSFYSPIVVDRSRGRNNGTLSGLAQYELFPIPLYPISFNNTVSKVTIPKTSSINDIAQLTFRCWFYYTNSIGEGDEGYIFYKGNKRLFIDYTTGQLVFIHDFTLGAYGCRTPIGSLVIGNWYCITFTYDNTSVSNDAVITLNGVQQTLIETFTPVGGPLTDNSVDLVFGNNVLSNRFLNGKLSDIEIYRSIQSSISNKRWYNATCGKYGKVRVP